jgi:hypothetical protein
MSNEKQSKKELIQQYKERPITGGVFRIVNTQTGRILLLAEPDLRGSKNRFDFSVLTGGCTYSALQRDWSDFGPKTFVFEILEEIEKKPDQTPKEFREDLDLLKELWQEKLGEGVSYY